MKPLETERLLLRNWEDRDRHLFHRINADEQVMEFFPSTRDRAESDKLMDVLRERIDSLGFGLAAMETRGTGECMGFCGLNPTYSVPVLEEGAIEIGWRIVPEFWGKGYVTEAGRRWLAFAFDTLGLDEVVSFAVWNNDRSTAVMRRLGMRHDPTRDFVHPRVPDSHPHLQNHVLYAISRAEWETQKAT